MIDRWGRNINYMRISVTDRCNLRCRYCMPNGVRLAEHREILRYEEILSVVRTAVKLGITHFKVTGGEPLVRRGLTDFLAKLKDVPGVEAVTLTTNGVLLEEFLPDLIKSGIDGINISLDTLDVTEYTRITGFSCLSKVLAAIEACVRMGICTKINCVLFNGCESRLLQIAELAERWSVDVRFIEWMPLGHQSREEKNESGKITGAEITGAKMTGEDAVSILRTRWPDLHPVNEARGFGPAYYYGANGLKGRIGVIDAVSHNFCAGCNRVRLTGTGLLKPCLCYGEGADLKAVLRGEGKQLIQCMEKTIFYKPRAHCFNQPDAVTERSQMNQIGG